MCQVSWEIGCNITAGERNPQDRRQREMDRWIEPFSPPETNAAALENQNSTVSTRKLERLRMHRAEAYRQSAAVAVAIARWEERDEVCGGGGGGVCRCVRADFSRSPMVGGLAILTQRPFRCMGL